MVVLATLSQLVPFSELSPGQAGSIRNEIIKKVVAEAVARTKLAETQIVVRDIRAKDDLTLYSGGSAAGLEDWGALTDATANVYGTMATGIMADQRWMAFYGVKADKDAFACTAIRFTVGGSERVIWQLQALAEEDGFVGYCPAGVIIPPNTPYTIERFNREVTSSVKLVLKGVVVEPRGKVLSP